MVGIEFTDLDINFLTEFMDKNPHFFQDCSINIMIRLHRSTRGMFAIFPKFNKVYCHESHFEKNESKIDCEINTIHCTLDDNIYTREKKANGKYKRRDQSLRAFPECIHTVDKLAHLHIQTDQ